MDRDAHRVGHDDQVGEDADAAEQHVALSGHELDGPEGPDEGLDGGVGADDRFGAAPEDCLLYTSRCV